MFEISQTANSQNWAPIGAKWHYGYLQSIFTPDQGYYLFEYKKDTVVQGHNCKKIIRKDFAPNGNIYDLSSEIFYSENNKVYHLINNQFYVLYDFGANQGDTWEIRIPYEMYNVTWWDPDDSLRTVFVDSVKMITIDSQELKVLYTSTLSNTKETDWYFQNPIIENIGSNYMFPGIWLFWDTDIPSLRCYEDSQIFYQKNSEIDCDLLVYDSFIEKVKESFFKIYPNPVNDFISISNINNLLINKIIISDITGKSIIEINSDVMPNRINLSQLYEGIYFISFYQDKQLINTKKIIKI